MSKKERVIEICKRLFFELLSYALVFVFYWKIAGVTVAAALAVVLAAYGASMAVCEIGKRRLLAIEKSGALTNRMLILCSLMIVCPIWLLWLLLSLIPIQNYNIWFITGFPVALLSAFPLIALSDHFEKRHRLPFFLANAAIYLLLLSVGQWIGTAVLS